MTSLYPPVTQAPPPIVHSAPAPLLSLAIEGMHCASCVARVETALKNVPGVQSAAVNLASNLDIVHAANNVDPAALAAPVAIAVLTKRRSFRALALGTVGVVFLILGLLHHV